MVLSDTEIQRALETGVLEIDPTPDEDRFDPVSVDLTLHREFFGWRHSDAETRYGEIPAVRIRGYDYRALATAHLEEIPLDRDGCVAIQPQEFLLAQTRERLQFPPDLAGRVEGKSSLARLGLSVQAAPTIHAGWGGHITLELHNVGSAPLKLEPGAAICQLLVERVEGPPTASMEETQFQDQDTPRGRT